MLERGQMRGLEINVKLAGLQCLPRGIEGDAQEPFIEPECELS